MRNFLCRTNPDIYFCIYLHFVANKDYNSNCFKIINWHYLKYIEDKGKQQQQQQQQKN